jgi:hypothetical protein
MSDPDNNGDPNTTTLINHERTQRTRKTDSFIQANSFLCVLCGEEQEHRLMNGAAARNGTAATRHGSALKAPNTLFN